MEQAEKGLTPYTVPQFLFYEEDPSFADDAQVKLDAFRTSDRVQSLLHSFNPRQQEPAPRQSWKLKVPEGKYFNSALSPQQQALYYAGYSFEGRLPY